MTDDRTPGEIANDNTDRLIAEWKGRQDHAANVQNAKLVAIVIVSIALLIVIGMM